MNTTTDASATIAAIRPERILLENDAGLSANGLPGIVDDLAFRGSDTLYRVRLESGTILRVVAANSGHRDPYRPGDRVRVQIPPDALKAAMLGHGLTEDWAERLVELDDAIAGGIIANGVGDAEWKGAMTFAQFAREVIKPAYGQVTAAA